MSKVSKCHIKVSEHWHIFTLDKKCSCSKTIWTKIFLGLWSAMLDGGKLFSSNKT